MTELKISRKTALIIGFIGFLVLVALDIAATYRVSLLILNLPLILLVTWYVSAAWGIFFSLAMTVVQVIASVKYSESGLFSVYWYLDVFSDFAAAMLLVWLQAMLKRSHDRVEQLARHDRLTGSLNRAGFYENLEEEFARSKRYNKPFSLIYFDCDNFKTVNDTLGHHVGDKLLTQIAVTLRSHLRRVDSVSRLGGDEFAILLPETHEEAARKTIDHLKLQLDMCMHDNNWPVSFSIGIAAFVNPPDEIEHAIEMADALMYEVKKSGKNNVLARSF